jgi:hypothetical protein
MIWAIRYLILITHFKGDRAAHFLHLSPPVEVSTYNRAIGNWPYLRIPPARNWHYFCHTQRTGVLRSYSVLFGAFLLFMSFTDWLASSGCWISSHYLGERIGLQYIWMCIAAFVDIVVYIALALIVRGLVTVNGAKIRFATGGKRVHRSLSSSHGHSSAGGLDGTTISIKLLFYPAVYIITVSLKQLD